MLPPVVEPGPVPGIGASDRVLVVGGYGMGNVGDEAMLTGLLARLGNVDVTVTSGSPRQTMEQHGVRAIAPRHAPGRLLRSSALVIGGGALFSDHMGTRGRLIPLFGLLARAWRRPVSLVGVSIDRSTPASIRPLVAALARRAAYVEVRDLATAKLLRCMGVAARQAPDLSAWVRAAPATRTHELLVAAGLQTERPIVALCLAAVESDRRRALLREIPRLVAALPNVQFCLVPMSCHPTSPRQDDFLLAATLSRRAPAMRLLAVDDPAELISVFGAFDAVISMRYHSLVFADRAGTPIIPLPYAQKCRVWIEEHGYAPVALDAETLTNHVCRALVSSRSSLAEVGLG